MERRPLVLVSGTPNELPLGDTLPGQGGGFMPNIIDAPLTIPVDESGVAVSYLIVNDVLTLDGNLGVI